MEGQSLSYISLSQSTEKLVLSNILNSLTLRRLFVQISASECSPFLIIICFLSGTQQLYLFLLIYYQSLFTHKALKSVSGTYWEWKSLCFFSHGYFYILFLDFPLCLPISLQDTWSQVLLACSLFLGRSWSNLIKLRSYIKSVKIEKIMT